MSRLKKRQQIARFLAMGVRDSNLEDLHAGKRPSSRIGDYSDVKVVGPYGEIPWKDLSRFNEQEMRALMFSIEVKIQSSLYELLKADILRINGKRLHLIESYMDVSWDREDWTQ